MISIIKKNGKYRAKIILIKKIVDNLEVIGEGFPMEFSIMDSFSDLSEITEDQFLNMTDVDFSQREVAFKSYLNLTNPFLDFSQTNLQGIDYELCVPGEL
jgi:hypothetical protein